MFKLFVLPLFFLIFYGRVFAIEERERAPINHETERREFSVFADADFNQPSRSFSPGQNIYVKVQSSNAGSKKKQARLLNSEKVEVLTVGLENQDGNFIAVLVAPNDQGVYYLDIRIDDGSSVYASQQNINIGEEKDDKASVLSSNVETKVVVDKIASASITVNSFNRPTDFNGKNADIKENSFNKIVLFFKEIFRNLTELFE